MTHPAHPAIPAHMTTLIQHDYRPPLGFEAMTVPVHKASTVFFASVAALRARNTGHEEQYSYGLHHTPTTLTLAARIASLEGGQHCLLCPSGLSALSVVNLALLKAGDEVLMPDNTYGPNVDMAQHLLAHMGIGLRLYDPLRADTVVFKANTRLMWLEAAGSITMEFPDLHGLVAQAKAHGVTTAIDHTWGAGLAFSVFDLGIDIGVHALTKYPSGGGDVLMGSIVSQDTDLHQRLKYTHGQLGLGVSANDTELVLRGLPTLALRYDQQDRQARHLAAWLEQQPCIAQVLHPALPHAAGHEYWQAVCADTQRAAGLFSVIFQAHMTQAQVDLFCDALRWFKLGFSWGGPISLVMPYDLAQIRPLGAAHLAQGCLVRFSIGLEDVADLQHDLAQALQTMAQ